MATGDPDVPDQITELKDGSGVRTGWRYYAADTQQTEIYDAKGILQSIALAEGTHQTLAYTDGTDGVASGSGGFVLDASGSPTSALKYRQRVG